jgi:RimJ/RimL family protein N-acetyltransferase
MSTPVPPGGRGQPSAPWAGLRFRSAEPADAAALLALKRDLDHETSFMLLEPDERSEAAQDVAADLKALAAQDNAIVVVAEIADRLVGYAEARGGRFRRARFTAYLVLGVLAEVSGHGTGSGLLAEVETWALAHGMHRLELTVMAHNERAQALYERMGFVVEGRRHECLLVDGRLVDELYMAKLLPYPAPAGAER